MAQYAIAFDLDTARLRDDKYNQSGITSIYQTEIKNALALAGFTAHPQGSLYHTEVEQNQITAIMQLQSILQQHAPQFCQYVKRVHVFRMEEWSDVTSLISNNTNPTQPLTPEEEFQNGILNE